MKKQKNKYVWSSYLSAMKLMYSFVRTSSCKTAIQQEVKIENRCYNLDIYSPPTRSVGTVVVFHGMSPEGAKDERIVHLAQCIAFAGYTVVCPEIQPVKDITISSDQIDMVAEILLCIQKDLGEIMPEHNPSNKIGALAPSFTAGLLLAAVARPEVGKAVGSVCSLGGFADVNKVLRFMFLEDNVDPYGRMVILKNFLRYSIKNTEEIEVILHEAILGNYFRLSTEELDIVFDSISPVAKKEFQKIMESKELRKKHLESILATTHRTNVFESFDIKRYVKQLSSSVFLLHGSNDNVIPSSESVLLYEEMQNEVTQHDRWKMVLTPFISHGDTKLDFMVLREVKDLVSGFAFFFREIHN